ncbi:MAG: response regulator [Coriobacteriales bacterium]|jgi:signal transduction histidine kinase/DNA-binding response OmpR family regulator|nr:response regulator [Coriobacteriales bacterium]
MPENRRVDATSWFDSAVNSSVTSSLIVTDNDLKIIYANKEALKVSERDLADVKGRVYSDYSQFPHNSIYDPIRALEEGVEAAVYYNEQSDRYIKATATRFENIEGNETGYCIFTVDVSEIELARQKAEQASIAKTVFLSNMSHEMRTPMNAIIGMSSIGFNSIDGDRKNYCFDKIASASNHLLGIINDVLDISKIEANKLELSANEFDFEKMLQHVMKINDYRIDEKKQELIVTIDSNIPKLLVVDEQRVTQVITNLLSNANKFTPEGGVIHLEAELLCDEGNTVNVRIAVTDSGIGISEEQMKRIFNEFEQASNETSRRFGGTGLGLAISTKIVEMMGGKLSVVSEEEKGSTFSFNFIAQKGIAHREALLTDGINLDNIRILVVDDDPVILEFFKGITERMGVYCDVARGSKEALELHEKNGSYDIYYVDWKMPEVDGIEFSKQLRELIENQEERSVVIMISASEWSEIEGEARQAGVDFYLPKPLFPSSIADSISNCIGAENSIDSVKAQTVAYGLSEEVGEVIDLRGKKILFAEDMAVNREIALAILEPTNAQVVNAENGAQVLELFSRDPESFDLIIMDIQMPEMDGLAATEQIRAMDNEAAKNIPIVAMTANVFTEDIERCLEAGMSDHIGKPLSFEEVLNKLKQYLLDN